MHTTSPYTTAIRLIAVVLLAAIILATARGLAADPTASGTISASVKVNALDVELAISQTGAASHRVIEVDVRNRSERALRRLEVTLHLTSESCLRLLGPAAHRRGLLGGGRTASAAWRVDLPRGAADCDGVIVLAQVSAVDADGDLLTMESDARLLPLSH